MSETVSSGSQKLTELPQSLQDEIRAGNGANYADKMFSDPDGSNVHYIHHYTEDSGKRVWCGQSANGLSGFYQFERGKREVRGATSLGGGQEKSVAGKGHDLSMKSGHC